MRFYREGIGKDQNIAEVVISSLNHYEFDAKDFPRYQVSLKPTGYQPKSRDYICGEFAVQVAPGGIALMRYSNGLFDPEVWKIETESQNIPLIRETLFRYGPLVHALAIQDQELELGKKPPKIVNKSQRDLSLDLGHLLGPLSVDQYLPALHALKVHQVRTIDTDPKNSRLLHERIFGRKAALYVINGLPVVEEQFGWAVKHHPNAELDKITNIDIRS
jgi:hypothetical protein